MNTNSKGQPAEYLGDAVYACYDGFMVGLTLDHHENEVMIWLEPTVLEALERFVKLSKEEFRK